MSESTTTTTTTSQQRSRMRTLHFRKLTWRNYEAFHRNY
jgi:hypothetical protein